VTKPNNLQKEKARLVFAQFEKQESKSLYPKQVLIEGFDKPFTHHSNLFSREGLDIGTRFFLQHIPKSDFKSIIDLGCANGIVGTYAHFTIR
jgi:16S rRNA G1207 methylase RsmC